MVVISGNGNTGSYVLIRDNSGTIQYSLNNAAQWTSLASSDFPLTITNSAVTKTNHFTVYFVSDLTFTSTTGGNSGIDCYFNIGSTYVKIDGQNYTVNINGITNYNGLVKNGFSPSYQNLIVKNINVNGSYLNTSLAASSGGYIGHQYFIYGQIINCSSSGDIAGNCGGIIGNQCGYSGNVSIIDCRSSGNISTSGGGIVGSSCGSGSGTVTITNCYSTGTISIFAGGICGSSLSGTITITGCYSIGSIGNNGGGIVGNSAGSSANSTINVNNSYSTGAITGPGSGGIFGYTAGNTSTSTITAINCYSTGTIVQYAGGIFGQNAGTNSSTVIATNCFYNGTDYTNNTSFGSMAGFGSTISASTANIYGYNNSWSNATADTKLITNTNVWTTTVSPYILKQTLTITAYDSSKTYGTAQTYGSGSTRFYTSGLQKGDTIGSITLTDGSGGGLATATAGTYALIPSLATGGTFDSANYTISYVNATLSVYNTPLSITVSDSKLYGQTKTYGSGYTSFTSTGLQNSETIGSITVSDTSSGGIATAGIGSYNLVPSAATGGTFTSSNYNITYTTGTLTVNAASLTITANNDSKDYGDTKSYGSGSTAFTSSGLQNSQTIGSVTLSVSSNGGSASAPVTTYTITPSSATGGTFTANNYNITYNTGTLTVNAVNLSITANNDSKNYGQTKTYGAGSTTFSSSGLKNLETIGTVTISDPSGGGVNTANFGSYSLIPSAATGGTFSTGNYNITYNNGTLSVNKVSLTITANNDSKDYGDTKTYGAGSTAFTSSGLQNSETIGTVTITDSSGGGINTANFGSYSLVPSSATGGTFTSENYNITYNNGTLTVNKVSLSITANNDSKNYGQTKTYGAGSTAFTFSGLKNSETINTITINDLENGGLNTASIGTYTLSPSTPIGSLITSNYNITYNNGTLTVNTAQLIITANNDSKDYGDTKSYGSGATSFTSSGLQNGETVGTVTLSDIDSGGIPTAPIGNYTLVPSNVTGGTFQSVNYDITYIIGILTINTELLEIIANNDDKIYGEIKTYGIGMTTFTSIGLKNSETIGTITISDPSGGGLANASIGVYDLIPSNATGGTFNITNYNITYTFGTLTVTQATLTITANDESKAYGELMTFGPGDLDFTSNGLKNDDNIGSITVSDPDNGGAYDANVGSYTLVPSNPVDGTFNINNYFIFYIIGILLVFLNLRAYLSLNGSNVNIILLFNRKVYKFKNFLTYKINNDSTRTKIYCFGTIQPLLKYLFIIRQRRTS